MTVVDAGLSLLGGVLGGLCVVGSVLLWEVVKDRAMRRARRRR